MLKTKPVYNYDLDQCNALFKKGIFPIGIGSGANMQRLQQFSPKREPLKLKGLMLSEFFDWLGKSVKTTSQSAPGTSVKRPAIGWAVL